MTAFLASPVGEVLQFANWGGEGRYSKHTLSVTMLAGDAS